MPRDPSDTPSLPASATDLALLRRFEPVVRYTAGEQFYPATVEDYVRECALWAHYPDGEDEALVGDGQLTIDSLATPRAAPFGTVLYMKLVGSLNLLESAQALRERASRARQRERFVRGLGRLARVGYAARIVDAGFSLSLLLRGRVPGATAAAAEVAYHRVRQADDRHPYYGRVVRMADWVVLQYWFFYFYNSWRSGFDGVNDHESDWEQILVYLYEDGGELKPRWVACASHDFHGGDIRRRWDDEEELELADAHPVVYAGAGSHASYFRRGEYQTDVVFPWPDTIKSLTSAASGFWTGTLGQAGRSESATSMWRIPFVDYARGDGLAIGPGQVEPWSPVLLEPVPDWVSRYRGLWGLYARDPLSGENAPAGPMYNRDGTVRASWYDPIRFAGLDRVPPPPAARRMLVLRRNELVERSADIDQQIRDKSGELQRLGTELAATRGQPHLKHRHEALTDEAERLGDALTALRRESAETEVFVESIERQLAPIVTDLEEDPRAHIRHLAIPVSASEMRFGRLVEVWAAISLGLLLLAVVAIAWLVPQQLVFGLLALVLVFAIVESVVRGTYARTINAVGVTLALITLSAVAAHVVTSYWRQAILVTIGAVGLFVTWENLRDLRR